MTNEKEFVNGLIVKAPNDKAPDFVKCTLSIRREELMTFLSGKTEDWINLDVKVSQKGKWYAEVNNWKPEGQQQTAPQKAEKPAFVDNDLEDIPW